MQAMWSIWEDFIGTPEKSFELSMSFKIVASFVQMLASFPKNFQVDWSSPTYNFVSNAAPFLQIEITELPGLFCYFGKMPYYDVLKVTTVTPLVIIFLMSLPCLYTIIAGRIAHGGSRNHPRYEQTTNAFVSSLMMLLFLLYPSLSSRLVRCFYCIDYGEDGFRLFDDHNVECYNADWAWKNEFRPGGQEQEHLKILIWASVFIAVYPIGIIVTVSVSMALHQVPKMANRKHR